MTPRIYFVYGTLRPGGRYWSNVAEFIETYEPAYIDGYRLRHLPEGYPAILRGAQRVFGDLLFVRSGFEELVSEIIDEIEGYREADTQNLYDRIEVRAVPLRRAERLIAASTYLYGASRHEHFETAGVPVESGDWREFVADHEELEP